MLTLAKLFVKSPFAPLQSHMDKVACCIDQLPSLFKAILSQNMPEIDRISAVISKLEHEADLTKNDIRTHLPKSLFLPVDRSSLLEILSLQDAIADQAEEIAHHAQMRQIVLLEEMKSDFSIYTEKNIASFRIARKTIKELDELLESSFGGLEAQKVKGMVEQIAFYEYEIDLIRDLLLKKLYQGGDAMPHPAFHLCVRLIEEIGTLSRLSEELGNRIRMLLELK